MIKLDNMFNFKGNNVEIFEYNGEILFNPRDVGECLGIVDVKSSIRNFSKTQKIKITNNDLKVHAMHFRKLHNTGETFLKEAGVYKLIFKSHKKEAEEFQDWVTDSVLPTLRQTGGYVLEGREDEFVDKYFPSFSEEVKLAMVQDLMKQNKELKVNSDKYKQFMDTDGTFGFRNLVKHLNGLGLNVKETQVRNKLKEKGIICKQGNKYVISQNGIRDGYGIIKDNIVGETNRPISRYTEKLRDYLIEEFENVANN